MSSINIEAGNVDTRPARPHASRHLLGDLLMFMIPFVQFVRISGLGELYGSDFIILPALPFLLLKEGRQLLARRSRAVLVLGSLWLFNQILTDVIRETPFGDWSRGFSKIVTFFFAFTVLYLLSQNRPQRLFIFAVGLGLGGIVTYFVNPDLWAHSQPWKFGYGPPIAWLCVAGVCVIYDQRWSGPIISALFLTAVGVAYVLLGSRALGATLTLSGAFLAVQQYAISRRRRGRPLGWPGFAVLGLLGMLVGGGLLQLYGVAASEGMLGLYQQQKYLVQSRGNLGVFLSGRNEILASSRAIMDSPLIGHGSWAKDRRYQIELYQALREAGQAPNFDPSDPQMLMLIPSHSHIAGTWVEAGIMGGIFWAWIFWLGIRSLLSLSQSRRRFSPLLAFVVMTMLWAILFSPFGGPGRLLSPFYLCCTLAALEPVIKRARTAKPSESR